MSIFYKANRDEWTVRGVRKDERKRRRRQTKWGNGGRERGLRQHRDGRKRYGEHERRRERDVWVGQQPDAPRQTVKLRWRFRKLSRSIVGRPYDQNCRFSMNTRAHALLFPRGRGSRMRAETEFRETRISRKRNERKESERERGREKETGTRLCLFRITYYFLLHSKWNVEISRCGSGWSGKNRNEKN